MDFNNENNLRELASESHPQKVAPRALVFVLQDAINYALDAKDDSLANELQAHVDNVKAFEDFLIEDEKSNTDGECVDKACELFGFEVR